MRTFLMTLCVVAACVLTTNGRPHGGRKGGCKGGQVCSLTNVDTSVTTTSDCRQGFECGTVSLEFLIRESNYEASFCTRVAEADDDEVVDEDPAAPELLVLDDDDVQKNGTGRFVKYLLRRACSINNGTAERTRDCPVGEECTLAAVGVQLADVFLTAKYCQAEPVENVDWLTVFNGNGSRDSKSSESVESSESLESSESSESSESVESVERARGPQASRDGRRGGRGGRPRRHAPSMRPKPGPCNITTADGQQVLGESACPEESACTVGPLAANFNGQDISIFFCERPERPDSSEETTAAPVALEEDEDFERFAPRMFCNACELSKNETAVEARVSCADTCTEGPLSTNIKATSVQAKFCSSDDFNLLDALTCGRPEGSHEQGDRPTKGDRPSKGGRPAKGGRSGEGKKPRRH